MGVMAGTHTDWTDAEILTALRMRDRGTSAATIGRALGRSRSSVLGILKRIADDLAKSDE